MARGDHAVSDFRSIADMLAAHTDAALEALASRGALRRAMRDLDNGKASIVAKDETSAEVLADGQSVRMPADGPAAANCTCPAQGVCRHILLAVLALRGSEDDGGPAADQTSASEHLRSLTGESIQKFAGADGAKATSIASEPGAVDISTDGPNVSVTIEDLGASVTFIGDQGLRKAVYKGKKTLQRVAVTVAALLVRQAQGIETDPAETIAPPTVSAEFLDGARRRVESAAAAVLPGRSAAAEDMFLDLAVSSRVEALPRLSSELRALATQARQSVSRDIGFEPDQFLKAAARTCALLEALKQNPTDVAYTGVIRRNFVERANFEAWPLGVAQWRHQSGARGLSVYAWSPSDNRWYFSSDGRASGVDPSFDPHSVYRGPLWGAGTIDGLIGTETSVSTVRVSEDGAVSMAAPGGAVGRHRQLAQDELLESDCAHHDWLSLRLDLAQRFGRGLRRRALPQPALIVPNRFGEMGFNDLEQVYEWEARDISDEPLLLTIDGHDHETALRLKRWSRNIESMLIEATIGRYGLVYRPVTAYSTTRKKLDVRNLDFDPWPYRRPAKLEDLLDRIGSILKRPGDLSAAPDPLQRTVDDSVDALIASATQAPTPRVASLKSACEASGLLALSEALGRIEQTPTIPVALQGAYIASEIETALWFDYS